MSNYQFVVFSTESSESSTKNQDVTNFPSSLSTSSSCKQLIMSTEDKENRMTNESELRKQQIRLEPKLSRKRASPDDNDTQLQRELSSNDANTANIDGKYTLGKAKIPRPANAFMLFANEWRKKLAVENPRESNKDISVRLGVLWKNMAKDSKEKYFSLAREVDAAHKKKYPDYVYNPKEARLRKAMREQSRELSRQSILQNTNSTISGNTKNISGNINNRTDGTGASNNIGGTGNFTNHHPMSCASPAPAVAVSSLSRNSSYTPSSRIVNPWFSAGHTPPVNHMKPMLAHRVMQTHQRTFDKTKEVLRKHAECAGAFSAASAATACYPSDFNVHGAPTLQTTSDPSAGGLESNDYCGIGEVSDGQKWHPYQSTVTPYYARSGSMSKMTSRHGVQNIHSHGYEPWNQFCGVPLFTMPPQNPMIRGPRHRVFLQEQQERLCGFPEESPNSYMTNKMDVSHRLQSAYPQPNYQQESEKCIEDAPRWETPKIRNHLQSQSESGKIPLIKEPQPMSQQENIQDQHVNKSVEFRQSKMAMSKQPLPGFHQAFGSTEIGRFSRSEYFANMVGENNGGVSINPTSSIELQKESASSSSPSCLAHHQDVVVGTNNNENTANNIDSCDGVGTLDGAENLNGLLSLTPHYDNVKNTMPRWHSPYVSAIGGDV